MISSSSLAESEEIRPSYCLFGVKINNLVRSTGLDIKEQRVLSSPFEDCDKKTQILHVEGKEEGLQDSWKDFHSNIPDFPEWRESTAADCSKSET